MSSHSLRHHGEPPSQRTLTPARWTTENNPLLTHFQPLWTHCQNSCRSLHSVALVDTQNDSIQFKFLTKIDSIHYWTWTLDSGHKLGWIIDTGLYWTLDKCCWWLSSFQEKTCFSTHPNWPNPHWSQISNIVKSQARDGVEGTRFNQVWPPNKIIQVISHKVQSSPIKSIINLM